MDLECSVYILTNKKRGVLYTGSTRNLPRRIWEHKERVVPGFTQKYNLHKLVYYEVHSDLGNAVMREKQIKRWKRDWKIKLIETENPEWRDLSDDF